jgi:hypothetical protein
MDTNSSSSTISGGEICKATPRVRVI